MGESEFPEGGGYGGLPLPDGVAKVVLQAKPGDVFTRYRVAQLSLAEGPHPQSAPVLSSTLS